VGSRPEVDDTYAQYIAGQTMDWSRLGYVQVVREHVELCSAVMLLSDLHRMKSPARRILMFPRLWLAETEDGIYGPDMATTRRLLGTAARRYGVSLMPMEPIVEGADGESTKRASDEPPADSAKTHFLRRIHSQACIRW
jgi:hypothetical protein